MLYTKLSAHCSRGLPTEFTDHSCAVVCRGLSSLVYMHTNFLQCLNYIPVSHSRLHQAAKLLLYSPSSGLYSCPLAMTDGAAKLVEVNFSFSWSATNPLAADCFVYFSRQAIKN